MRLQRCRVQRNLSTTAQRQAKRCNHDGLWRKLYCLSHGLKLPDRKVNVIPLFFLNGHEQQHDIRTDGKVIGIVSNHESVETITGPAGLK